MARTESTMIALGTQAPEFSLPDVVKGGTVSLAQFADRKLLLVMFICRHCPYVKHIQEELARLGRDYKGTELGIVGISANDAATHPDDGPESLREMALELGLRYPLLYDETQDVAAAYSAACTPDFFLFDAARRLIYRGQLDDSRPGNDKPVTGHDLRQAIEAARQAGPVPEPQRPSVGCNIKWKAGRQPH